MALNPIKAAIDNAAEPDSGISYRRIADIKALPISWLWPHRFARGKVSMIAGDPGLGKSQLTASLAAIVTTGGKWPTSCETCSIGNVVILSAEDDAADTIRPRLEAAGANIERAFILDAVRDGDKQRTFNLAADFQKLEALLKEISGVALVIIDPITAYMGGVDSHKTTDVRAALAPLSDMAAKQNAAIICVSHLNKGGSAQALMRVTGSLAFVAAARATYVVAKDKERPERRMLLPIKNNIGNDEVGFAFTIQSHALENGIKTSRVEWEEQEVSISADQALSVGSENGSISAVAAAKAFLIDLLSENAVPATEVFDTAKASGHSKASIRRAGSELNIEKYKVGFDKDSHWVWQLPASKVLNKTEDAQPQRVSIFEKSEHLRQNVENMQIGNDAYEERAAIMEFDGGMSRQEAESAAHQDCVVPEGRANNDA